MVSRTQQDQATKSQFGVAINKKFKLVILIEN